MREVDRLMVEEIGVSIIMMMENASKNTAVLTRKLLGGTVHDKNIVILCGKGNNGGDGLGAARHLINYGATCNIVLAHTYEELGENARVQHDVLTRIHANVYEFNVGNEQPLKTMLTNASLVIDALLGYNLRGDRKEPYATMIRLANEATVPILAVDMPSGLSGDTGDAAHPTIIADTTLTLALPKHGLLTADAKQYVGKIYVADLSVPHEVYERIGLDVPPLFEKAAVVPLP